MESWEVIRFLGFISISIILISETCVASFQGIGKITPVFQGSEMNWIDNDGLFLLSNSLEFAFGFQTTEDVTLFLLVIVHLASRKPIWSANGGSPVTDSDQFVFNQDGKVFLQKGDNVVWTVNTNGKSISAIELQNSGNLVMLGDDNGVLWESFSHPTDTLMSNQDFVEGMQLVSNPSSNDVSYLLGIKSGDMVLSAGYPSPQTYWSMSKDVRKIINKSGGGVTLSILIANSWNFYDQNKVLLWQFVFSDNTDANATWIAVLGNDGFISFYNLQNGGSIVASATKIPNNPCSTPESCDSYYVCSGNNRCQCSQALTSRNCNTGIVSPCDGSEGSTELLNAGDDLNYFALPYVTSSSKTDLNGCKAFCLHNCSCLALFFQNSTGNCFLFDSIGSFQSSDQGSGFVAHIKVLNDGGDDVNGGGHSSNQKRFPYVVIIVISTLTVILALLYVAFRYYRNKKKRVPESPQETSDEDNFLETLSGMPVRFSYRDLQNATNNFSVKPGLGGFGSVYQGVLPDGTRLAVKKLEGIGQGKKEFRAEVSIIGSIHHLHLVKLKGFCAEGAHRLLAYEYMANGSLDKWIFRRDREDNLLDWETRFNIALGTAKGLAYLHEDCDAKIVHCDIKPENVLLDENFLAKVSDFGLAKLLTREQSHVFTTLRGTRGYLAPEWITNYTVSEKSDVYSYGMVLLEIIGGKKNYDPSETSEKSHFPSYTFKMMEEGKLRDVLDSRLRVDDHDERVYTAIKVALWCIQEDMYVRPSMTKVVQMLEGLCEVPRPSASSPLGTRLYSTLFKSVSGEGTSPGPSDCNSDGYLSAAGLSAPR
ncbi:G-type lectin S-receptor-like serine/threonine-protein kinase SD2-5 [Mangifera indica]|uniref:G-type lectin S-receptor-like serine/threonine-protein kinase SD2-5 n=1 Tax=Mangifera indica TaxID=29780 RepID=UPI001CF9C638|nr:G-type lectin S-receptor-like serine/threonine-protein kinase SD2-5 [Mangifera indica]